MLFAYARPGDIFVQKAPASTVLDFAEALRTIFSAKNDIKIIGTRHGEKISSLSFPRGNVAGPKTWRFYSIPIDDRDLNYSHYFTLGEIAITTADDYTSHNTICLNRDEIVELLLKLDYIRQELKDRTRN